MGITLEPDDEAPEEDTALWPENEAAARVFEALTTQWVETPLGPGLPYGEPLARVERELKLRRRDRRGLFHALRVMEDEGRQWFAERRQQHE